MKSKQFPIQGGHRHGRNEIPRANDTGLPKKTDAYDVVFKQALYHMRLQEGYGQGFRPRLKGLYSMMGVKIEHFENEADVSIDYYNLTNKRSMDRPSTKVLNDNGAWQDNVNHVALFSVPGELENGVATVYQAETLATGNHAIIIRCENDAGMSQEVTR